jgi:cytochrome c5
MSETHHEEAHTGPIKTPKQLLVTSILAFVVPVFICIGLAIYAGAAAKPAAGAVNLEKSVTDRLQKVGAVEVRDANRPLKAGADVFQAQCIACHGTGVAGAPKFGDAAAWGPRIKAGYDALLNSALKGKNAMAPQGGGDHSDIEIGRAVVYMANAGGAKFAEPKAPDAPATQAAK